MVGHPEIIVEEVADDLSSRLAEYMVTMQFPAARALGKIEKAYARVIGDELAGNRAGGVGHTVADDEHLDVARSLAQRRGDRIAKRVSVRMRRNQDGGRQAPWCVGVSAHIHGSSSESELRASLVSHPGSSSNCRISPNVSQ